MPEPLEFQIAQNLQAAIQSISKAGGYFHDVAAFAVKLDPNHEVEKLIADYAPRPFFLLEWPPEPSFEYFPAERIRLRIPFVVHAVNKSDPEDDDDMMKTYYRLCADVEKAIALDTDRGDKATDTRILGRQMREYEGRQVWAMVSGEIREHRGYGAPNG